MALLKIDDVATDLGTTPRHIRNLIALHGLPFVKVGGLVRIDSDELAEWIDARRRVNK